MVIDENRSILETFSWSSAQEVKKKFLSASDVQCIQVCVALIVHNVGMATLVCC